MKAIRNSGDYGIFGVFGSSAGDNRIYDRVFATKRANGSVVVRFIEFPDDQRSKPRNLLAFVFSASGIKKQVFDPQLKLPGSQVVANRRLCEAIAAAYSFWKPGYGSHITFDVEAQEERREILWQEQGTKKYKFYVRFLPREPGSSIGFALSKNFQVVAENGGT